MKLVFCTPKRALSFKDARNLEKGILTDYKGAKLDSNSPGGLALIMTTLSPTTLRLMVRRWGIDDTIIKITSERAIVRRLKDAMRIWEKVRQM